MKSANVRAILSRVLATQTHSLPRYLQYAAPWLHQGDERASAVLQLVSADQQRLAERIADYLLAHFGRVDSGEFPMEFTSMHDLSLDYLMQHLTDYQRTVIRRLEQCAQALSADSAAQALAQEALGAAKGHLESIEEVVGQFSK